MGNLEFMGEKSIWNMKNLLETLGLPALILIEAQESDNWLALQGRDPEGPVGTVAQEVRICGAPSGPATSEHCRD